MENNQDLNSQNDNRIKKKYLVYLVVFILLIVVMGIVISTVTKERPLIAIRIDDIQDYAYRDAQLHLINYGIVHQIPLSLAVIAGYFGNDEEIVRTVKLARSFGTEITVHGWKHENISYLSFEEQYEVLQKARDKIFKTTGHNSSIFVPPMFEFNEDTLRALGRQDYRILSTSIEFLEPGYYSEIISIPGMVELSDFSNNQWEMKTIESLEKEIDNNIKIYGFAVIVTHPQEFIIDSNLNLNNIDIFEQFIERLVKKYKIVSIDDISKQFSVTR